MDTLISTAALAQPALPASGQVPIRLVVWGRQPADHEHAVQHALEGWGRRSWTLAMIERSTDETCSVDVDDPDAIAAYRCGGWGYAAYRADR